MYTKEPDFMVAIRVVMIRNAQANGTGFTVQNYRKTVETTASKLDLKISKKRVRITSSSQRWLHSAMTW